jgi:hypothetical protein
LRSLHVLCVLFLTVSFAVAQNATTVEQAESACGPSSKNFSVKTSQTQKTLSQAEPGKAMIYVIEDWDPVDTGRMNRPTVRVGMDGKWMGATQGDSYLFFRADPGLRHLCVNDQSAIRSYGGFIYLTAAYGLNVKPDETYYFRARMPRGETFAYFPLILEPLNIDEAQLLLARYPHADSTVKK